MPELLETVYEIMSLNSSYADRQVAVDRTDMPALDRSIRFMNIAFFLKMFGSMITILKYEEPLNNTIDYIGSLIDEVIILTEQIEALK